MELQQHQNHRRQEEDSTGMGTQDVCDESKCVSKGLSSILDDAAFTCYGDDNDVYPMMCADGFLPKVVEDEPPLEAVHPDGNGNVVLRYFTCCPPDNVLGSATDATRHCSDPVQVNFSDPNANETLCDDEDSRTHPRRMKSSGEESPEEASFVCCDAQASVGNSTTTTDFLDGLECVPYRNEFYEAAKVKNTPGRLPVISCDFAEGDFLFPRPVGADTYASSDGRFHCCRNGPAMPPFVNDAAFKISIYPSMAIFCIVFVLSVILFVGLLVPLVLQLRDGSFQEAQRKRQRGRDSTAGSSKRPSRFTLIAGSQSKFSVRRLSFNSGNGNASSKQPSSLGSLGASRIGFRDNDTRSMESIRTNDTKSKSIKAFNEIDTARPGMNRMDSALSRQQGSSVWSSQRMRQSQRVSQRSVLSSIGQPIYSTYNLYLVHLAFLDGLNALYAIVLYTFIINGKFHPYVYSLTIHPSYSPSKLYTLGWAITTTYFNANLLINCIMVYQVFILLKSSRRARRIQQPSLKRVNLQVLGVYLLSMALGILDSQLRKRAWRLLENGEVEKSLAFIGKVPLLNNAVVLLPILYVVYVSILICCKGYMPKATGASPKDKAIRELAIYFFRIVFVFLGVWLPVVVATNIGVYLTGEHWPYLLGATAGPCQAIITFFVMLTKSDVKTYVVDLLTCSYFSGSAKEEGKNTSVLETEITEVKDGTSRNASCTNEESAPYTSSGMIEEEEGSETNEGPLEESEDTSGSKSGRSMVRFADESDSSHSDTALKTIHSDSCDPAMQNPLEDPETPAIDGSTGCSVTSSSNDEENTNVHNDIDNKEHDQEDHGGASANGSV